ncbi:hypothetical protein ASD8599_03009 [Ascidiaceihabitans donghaensis]|uniref:Uncharacterized protein n=1 Tax=Ascidiaceihabitans donghaensis TaxID=1510460 RepID=A0A2R8BGQ3_9RHOB|nr:hypothetical protein ASD8599_03009 [Ascidiaceihabitans donghaensis]
MSCSTVQFVRWGASGGGLSGEMKGDLMRDPLRHPEPDSTGRQSFTSHMAQLLSLPYRSMVDALTLILGEHPLVHLAK